MYRPGGTSCLPISVGSEIVKIDFSFSICAAPVCAKAATTAIATSTQSALFGIFLWDLLETKGFVTIGDPYYPKCNRASRVPPSL